MENQNSPQVIHKSSEQVGYSIKLCKVWTFFIVLQISLVAFKYKPGENPLFKPGIFGFLGLSLIVYIITSVVLSLVEKKTPTPRASCLRILIWHVCWTSGALTCGILSSQLLPHRWIILCFYTLILWVAPCKPRLRILRWLRPPSSSQELLDSIDPIVVELPVLHPAASTFHIQKSSGSSTSTPFSSDKGFEVPEVWKYV